MGLKNNEFFFAFNIFFIAIFLFHRLYYKINLFYIFDLPA